MSLTARMNNVLVDRAGSACLMECRALHHSRYCCCYCCCWLNGTQAHCRYEQMERQWGEERAEEKEKEEGKGEANSFDH